MDSFILKTDRQKIWHQFGKTEENVTKHIKVIKDWLKIQHHLPEVPADIMIQFFLTNSNFSIEKTKQCLDMYYSIRSLMPEIFESSGIFTPSKAASYNTTMTIPLPTLTEKLQRVIFFKINDVEVEKWDMNMVFSQFFNHVFEVRIREDLALGDIIVADVRFFKPGHLNKISAMDVKKAAFIFEEVWNENLQEIHIINAPAYAENIFNLCRCFLNDKLKSKIFIHKSLSELYKVVPKHVLPQEYGGNEKSLDELNRMWTNKINEYKGRFEKTDEMKVNEKLRPSHYKNSDIKGYYGHYMAIDEN